MSTPLTPQQEETVNAIAGHYREIIKLLGENPDREGLLKTPIRAARAIFRATRGYDESGQKVIEKAVFTHEGSRMVIVKDIEFYSFCEHHILPFLVMYPSDTFLTARLSVSASWLVWSMCMPADCRYKSA